MGKKIIIVGADFSANGIKGEIPVVVKDYLYTNKDGSYIELFPTTGLSQVNDIKKIEIVCKFTEPFDYTGSNRVFGYNNTYGLNPYTSSSIPKLQGYVRGIIYKFGEGQELTSEGTIVLEDKGEQDLSSASFNGVNADSVIKGTYVSVNVASLPLFMGGTTSVNSGIAGSIKVKSIKLYDSSDNLVFDGVAALDGENNPCLYDKVHKLFLYDETGNEGLAVE